MKEKNESAIWDKLFYLLIGVSLGMGVYSIGNINRTLEAINQDLEQLDKYYEEILLSKSTK